MLQTAVAEVLIDIEAQLRQLGQWGKIPPSEQALVSDQPFCVDTLTLPQWLQFIFLPAIYQILESDQSLPQRCGIVPIAEEYFRGTGLPSDALLQALGRIDELLTESD
ncbi:MAG: YqcC family protein [Halioglobus sp.]